MASIGLKTGERHQWRRPNFYRSQNGGSSRVNHLCAVSLQPLPKVQNQNGPTRTFEELWITRAALAVPRDSGVTRSGRNARPVTRALLAPASLFKKSHAPTLRSRAMEFHHV